MNKVIKLGLASIIMATGAMAVSQASYPSQHFAGKIKKNSCIGLSASGWFIEACDRNGGMWSVKTSPCGMKQDNIQARTNINICNGILRNTRSDWKGGTKQRRYVDFQFTPTPPPPPPAEIVKENPLPTVTVTGTIYDAKSLNNIVSELIIQKGNMFSTVRIVNRNVEYFGKFLKNERIGSEFTGRGSLRGKTNFMGKDGNNYEYRSNNHVLYLWKDSQYTVTEKLNTIQPVEGITTGEPMDETIAKGEPVPTTINIQGMVLEFKELANNKYKIVLGNHKIQKIKANPTNGTEAYEREIGGSYEVEIDPENVETFKIFLEENIGFKANEISIFSINGVLQAKPSVNKWFRNNQNHVIKATEFKVIRLK